MVTLLFIVVAASKHVLVKYNVERQNLKAATQITPGKKAPTLSPLENDNWIAVKTMFIVGGSND